MDLYCGRLTLRDVLNGDNRSWFNNITHEAIVAIIKMSHSLDKRSTVRGHLHNDASDPTSIQYITYPS